MAPNGEENRKDNLSTVSTILGLALFCTLIITILVRRLLIQRHIRSIRTNGDHLRGVDSSGALFYGWNPQNSAFLNGRSPQVNDDLDDVEPRIIALGARAALLRKPVLWEGNLTINQDTKSLSNNNWDKLQPCTFQLTTPHTTAQFPAPNGHLNPVTQTSRRSRVHPHLPFHRSNHDSAPAVPAIQQSPPNPPAPIDTSNGSNTPPTQDERPNDTVDGTNHDSKPLLQPHVVQLAFLIAMPQPHVPSYLNPLKQATFQRNRDSDLPPLEVGTTRPTCLLPSVLIKQEDLDSWWDLPSATTPHSRIFGHGLSAAAVERLFQPSRLIVDEMRPFPRNMRIR